MTKGLDQEPTATTKLASQDDAGKNSLVAHAIFNRNGLLTNFSDNFKDVFHLNADLITPGASISSIMDTVISKAGVHLSEQDRKYWRQKLRDYETGHITSLNFTGLGALRLTSKRLALQDGTHLYTFDTSPPLPTTLSQMMRLSRQVLSALEDVDEGFILYDDAGKLIYSNKRHRELYPEVAHMFTPGTDRQEVLNAYWSKVGKKATQLDQGSSKNKEAGTARGYRERQLPNGQWIQINEKATLDGGLVAIRTEITDLKAHQTALFKVNERLLEQAQELEKTSIEAKQATEAKSSFLSTMSHEIRTPLNGVIGMAQLLLSSKLDDEQRTQLDTIITSGLSLLEIINDILDMSKIEAGNVELEYTSFDLRELFKTAVVPLKALAEDSGLYLKMEWEPPTIRYVKTDSTRLRQVLINLLSNAIKFTLTGGITIKVEELGANDKRLKTLSVAKEIDETLFETVPHALALTVRDTGTGIAEDRIKSIFNSFTQEDSTITRKFGGTGLGLAIVKNLVELLGGQIYVTSKPNLGSSFELILPYYQPSPEEIQQLHDLSKPLTELDCPPLKVLVAEDNVVNATIAKAFLEKFGHSPILVMNGEKAVEAMAEEQFDLIFMDIHMPQMDGIEATLAIRKGNIHSDIPIIGLTAEAFSERHAHFIDIGMNDVLSKPFTEQQLKGTIAKYMDLIDQQRNSDQSSSLEFTPEDNSLGTDQGLSEEVSENMSTAPDGMDQPVGSDEEYQVMKDQIGEEVLSELIGMAPDTINTQLDKLNDGISSNDSEAIYLAAHTIKGSASSMFAPRLADQAKVMEDLSKDFAAANTHMSILNQTAQDTITWWNSKITS